MTRVYLGVAEVEAFHSLVLEHSGGSSGLRDRAGLESAVFRPQCGYYANLIEETAALIESLVNNHPFVDGNKRTAVVCAEVFLDSNGYTLAVDAVEANRFILEHLKKDTFRFPFIKAWLDQVVQQKSEKE